MYESEYRNTTVKLAVSHNQVLAQSRKAPQDIENDTCHTMETQLYFDLTVTIQRK